MTKEVSLFNLGFLVLWTLYPPWRRGELDRRHLSSVALLLGGCSLAVALTIAPFVVMGAFGDFWDAAVVYTLHYLGANSPFDRIIGFVNLVVFPSSYAGPWVVLPLLGFVYLMSRGEDRWQWLVPGWLVAGVISIVFLGRLYAHYFVHILPALSLMVPFGVRFLRQTWHSAPRRVAVYGLLIAASAAGTVLLNAQVYLHPSVKEENLAVLTNDYQDYWYLASPALAQYVADNTSPDARIYNLGFQSELYFYSDRRSPTRYMFDHLFVADGGLVEAALRDLEEKPPVLIIDSARYSPARAYGYDRAPFDRFLAQRYQYLGKLYYADVYRLKESPTARFHRKVISLGEAS